MKQFKSSLLYIGCLSLLLQGCSHNDSLTDGTDVTDNGTALTILAHDSGYTAADGTPTRAMEDGYTTTFANGDKIGVFAVKGSAVIDQNVPCTYNDGEWTGNVYYYKDAEYFAYYPYNANLSTEITITTPDDIVTAFKNKLTTDGKNQSTYAKYTALDLMTTTSVSPRDKSLTFSFTHQMALVVISLPKVKYTFTNNPTIPDYIVPMPDTQFMGFNPYPMPDGTYRYLVAPSTSINLSGSYTASNGETIEYTCATASSGIAASKYKNYVVDSGIKTTTYNLQVGDFFMNDGSLLGKDEDLSAEQKAACLGVVLKVGKDGNGNWNDDCSYKLKDGTTDMTTIHGYVLALYNANGGNYCQWGSYGTKVEHTDMNREQETGFYGYKNTNAIKSFAASQSKTLQTDFPATYYATEDYEIRDNNKYASPANSSGWFLPSAGQCKYWLNIKTSGNDILLRSITKANGDRWKGYYWSSSEGEYYPSDYAWCLVSRNGQVDRSGKRSSHYIRSCLAF